MDQHDLSDQTLLKPSSLARRWDCSVAKVYQKVRSGELDSVWLDGDMRITRKSAEEFEVRLRTTPRPAGKGGRPKGNSASASG